MKNLNVLKKAKVLKLNEFNCLGRIGNKTSLFNDGFSIFEEDITHHEDLRKSSVKHDIPRV